MVFIGGLDGFDNEVSGFVRGGLKVIAIKIVSNYDRGEYVSGAVRTSLPFL